MGTMSVKTRRHVFWHRDSPTTAYVVWATIHLGIGHMPLPIPLVAVPMLSEVNPSFSALKPSVLGLLVVVVFLPGLGMAQTRSYRGLMTG